MAKHQTAKKMIALLDKTYEFDREPISKDKFHEGWHFAGLFAGEHVAATEFVIGALFVTWGAGVSDIIFGLLLGNLFAVLSWTFVTAPLAVQTRLTLYWYIRKITGPSVTLIYNILNAVLYCILAGAMITVAASAVRIPFNIPPQTQWFPEDIRFVVVVLFVGAVVVTFAILGFKRVAQFASVCSPWMLIMFIAGAVATLPMLAASVPEIGRIKSVSDFWNLADSAIWTGQTIGQATPIGFWHVAAFAWITNLAMHLGLSDMAIFRYAKRSSYGLFSMFGMYLGHYLAWIAAGIMGAAAALAFGQPLIELDSGAVAFNALGVSGAIAVVIAGWTTSNPTLYRAGLALQVVTPNWPRWLVTLIAGMITIVIATSPFVFTKLLDFVGIYGLLLMPIGAVVTVEHWIFPKLGLSRFRVSGEAQPSNWPVLAAWFIAIVIAMFLWQANILHLFFLFIPVWFITVILYIVFVVMVGGVKSSPVNNKKIRPISVHEKDYDTPKDPERAKSISDHRTGRRYQVQFFIAGIIALVALLLCLMLPLQVFVMGVDGYSDRLVSLKTMLIWLSLIYFISGTIWIYLKEKSGKRGQNV